MPSTDPALLSAEEMLALYARQALSVCTNICRKRFA